MILGSDRHTDVSFVERRIARFRYEELAMIKQSGGTYHPKKFYAALPLAREFKFETEREDVRFWRYFNACNEPYYSQVIELYINRAKGLEAIANTMQMSSDSSSNSSSRTRNEDEDEDGDNDEDNQ